MGDARGFDNGASGDTLVGAFDAVIELVQNGEAVAFIGALLLLDGSTITICEHRDVDATAIAEQLDALSIEVRTEAAQRVLTGATSLTGTPPTGAAPPSENLWME